MNLYFVSQRFRRLSVPGAFLIALLQRAPVVRVAAVAETIVIDSPIGNVLRSVLTLAASLGAVHSMAGATPLTPTSGSATGISVTTGTAVQVAYTVKGTDTPPLSWRVVGSIPPGLNFSGLTGSGGLVNVQNLTLTGTPSSAGTFDVTITAYEGQNGSLIASPNYAYRITVSGTTTVTAPSIVAQPQNQTVSANSSVTFTVIASGSPAPTYQWQKNGANILGENGTSLGLANVQASDAGTYSVVVTNSAGSVTSNGATLTVTSAGVLPVVTVQPSGQQVAVGSTVVFNATVTGATGYRWQRNGADISGATSATLVLSNVAATSVGSYALIASNSTGSVITNSVQLDVVASSDPGRLINLAILTTLAPAETMTMGTVLGPASASGTKSLLVRAGGPSLATFGISSFAPDPKLSLVSGGTTVASNNDWGNDPALIAAFNQTGAFAFIASSKDAAVFKTGLQPGNYSAQVSDATGSSGSIIAEMYDGTPGTFSPSGPRLINVSVLKQIAAGDKLTAGFVVGGSTAKTVLIRVIGPGIAVPPFNVGGAMTDPQLTLFKVVNGSSVQIASNDNWGGDAQISSVANSIGAFGIQNTQSKDAMLLVTLAPGNYSAEATGVGGTGGNVIVEVYEVP
jgi:hypothetical protein